MSGRLGISTVSLTFPLKKALVLLCQYISTLSYPPFFRERQSMHTVMYISFISIADILELCFDIQTQHVCHLTREIWVD